MKPIMNDPFADENKVSPTIEKAMSELQEFMDCDAKWCEVYIDDTASINLWRERYKNASRKMRFNVRFNVRRGVLIATKLEG